MPFLKVGIDALSAEELEIEFAAVKKQLLDTDVYANESRYRRLYCRLEAVQVRLLGRHHHLKVGVEGKYDAMDRSSLFVGDRQDSSRKRRVNSTIKLAQFDDELIFYLAFIAFMGGHAQEIGSVESNPEFALKALDFLIEDREFNLAIFLKGVILKYGLKPYWPPELDKARELLERAAKRGIGSAALEMQHFDRYSREFDGFIPKLRRAT